MTLEEKAYKALPLSIRQHIMTNPDKFPEYSQVLMSKRNDLLGKYKNRINLDPNEIKLMLTIIKIYNYIKNDPPTGNVRFHELSSWNKFIKVYDPNFINLNDINSDLDYDEYLDRLPKSFWLTYYTYLISYRKYYKLKDDKTQEKEFILEFNRKKDKFSTFIYKQYKYLDENMSLDALQYLGY